VVIMAARARVPERTSSLAVPLLVLTLAAAAAGALTLGAAGGVGAVFPAPVRAALATTGFAVLLVAALRRSTPWQRDLETPARWLELGDLRVAVWNGLALGSGAATRVGFWLWWVLPAFAFASGSPAFGALLGGVYGGTRLALSSALAAVTLRTGSGDTVQRILAGRSRFVPISRFAFFVAVGAGLACVVQM
jgi:hypothetical protein